MEHPHTVITRACEHMGHYFEIGDVVDNHDQAEFLVRLGFAEHPDPPAVETTEETTDTDEVSTTTRRTPRPATVKET